MSAASLTSADGSARRKTISIPAIQNAVLALLLFSGCVAFIEPSPFEAVFVVALLTFLFGGVRLPAESIPLLVLLTLFNLGGVLSLMEVMHDAKAITFTAISVYLACVTILFMMLMVENTSRRMQAILNAHILAAMVAGVTGTLGYFNVAGLSAAFTSFDGSRASGMFKDPNVFGPFIGVAATILFNRIVNGSIRWFWTGLAMFGFLCFAVLLSFSRGAWGVLAFGLVMVIGLNLAVSRSWRERRRIAVVTMLGAAGLVCVGAAALTSPVISTMLEDRAQLIKSYDAGETGRFGNQRRSIPLLLDLPNGFGPLQFDKKFTENPHNVYIYAFSSYGWLGGISYFALIALTCVMGWRLVFQRSPWQKDAIGLWCCLFPQIVQGFQIDTDHWRHFWWLFGMVWGLAIMSNRLKRAAARDSVAHLPPGQTFVSA
ncbi:O-antigen ligase family protein [Alsobacter sp. KACC 23698]|uniref:O-antigen ligase family protein n=1 Tax=Alsobacter sp. KACC 23698 TaxID=3149229 RepID=A0AAU7JMT5_9HYPH